MARGRKALTDPPVPLQVYIPESLALRLELLLHDPVRGRCKYGSKSALVSMILRDWLDKPNVYINTGINIDISSISKEPNVPGHELSDGGQGTAA